MLTSLLFVAAFTSYGAFWLSYAAILWPSSGILASYESAAERQSALGIYLITWFLVTFFFLFVRSHCALPVGSCSDSFLLFSIASLRKNVGFIALFGLLFITFILLAAGEFQNSVK